MDSTKIRIGPDRACHTLKAPEQSSLCTVCNRHQLRVQLFLVSIYYVRHFV